MRVLITGATGYIGRRLVQQLVEQMPDIEILTLSRDIIKAQLLLPYKQCYHGRAKEATAIQDFKPEIVLHLATMSTSRDDDEVIEPMIDANISYGLWLMNELSKLPDSLLFVNVGSFAEYRFGRDKGFAPAYLYTATKTAFRSLLQYYTDLRHWKVITAVPYSVYGGRDTQKKLIDYMFEAATAEEPVKMTAGEQVLDFIHVQDVVRFFIAVVRHSEDIPQGEYHLGTGVGTRVRDLAALVEEEVGKTLHINWGGHPYRPMDVMYAVASNSEELYTYWKPQIDLRTGIRMHINEIYTK